MDGSQIDLYLKQLEDVFHEMARRLQSELSQTMMHNMTPSQFIVIKKLSGGKTTVSELADYLGVSLSAVTSLVDRLSRSGFVERIRDEQDRRLVWLEITPVGLQVLNECIAKRKEVIKKILGQLPEEDLRSLNMIYGKILNIIKQLQNKEG